MKDLTEEKSMSETKQVVFNSNHTLLQKECNIQIKEQKLLKKDDQICAQINFKNLGQKPIKAVFIKIDEYNILHEMISQNFEYQYLDLDIWRGQTFGQEAYIKLKHTTTREIKIYIDKVVYLDGTIWSNDNEERPINFEEAQLMSETMESELIEQYKRESDNDNIVTDNDIYNYTENEDNWICTCGGQNFSNETRCYKCGKQKTWIIRKFDKKLLREDLEKHKFQQENYKQQVKQVSNNIQKDIRPQNKILSYITKKNKIILGIIIGCIAIVVLISTINSNSKYRIVSNSLTKYEDDFGELLGLSPSNTMWSEYIDDGYYFDDGDEIEADYEIGNIKGTVKAYENNVYDIGKVGWTPNSIISSTDVKNIIEYMKKKYGSVEVNAEYIATNSDYDLYSWTNESDDYNIFLYVDESKNDIEIVLEEKDYENNNSTGDYDEDYTSDYDDSTDNDTPEVTGSGSFQSGAVEEYENR